MFPIGKGTKTIPYQIQTRKQLIWITTRPSLWSYEFILVTDIDMLGI
jgi:hypothetical protein